MKWNGETDPQLGNIAGIREIDVYLRNMTFGRKLFGCDPEEVQEGFSKVAREYQAIIASLLSRQGRDEQVQQLEASLVRVSQENAALCEWNAGFEQANASLLTENEQLRQENAALYHELRQRGYYY